MLARPHRNCAALLVLSRLQSSIAWTGLRVAQVADVLELVEEKALYPMIVFSFARMECEAFAMACWTKSEKSGKLDFTTPDEKAAIEQVRLSFEVMERCCACVACM
jgi:superfamily II RNA helicase